MKLVVGLGNPTDKYKNNRHNIGFMVVDKLIDDLNAFDISKSSFKGLLYKSSNTLLLKPTTYMNLSGESVYAVCSYYKIYVEDIVVIHDDLDIEFGKIKIKQGGGHGGHNGLKSIDKYCNKEYKRVRIGIGKPKNQDVIKHVLSDFSKEESSCLKKIIDFASKLTLDLIKYDIKEVQNSFSSKISLC